MLWQQLASPSALLKRPWFKMKRIVIPLALLVMFFVIGLAGGGGSDPATVAAAPASDSNSTYVPDPTQFPSDEAPEEPTTAAPTAAAPTKNAPTKAAATKAAPTKEPKPKQVLSDEQQEAVGSAQDYLDSQGFSEYGLIHQLSSKYGSGFKKKDAMIAVKSLHVNYNEQAVRVAKDYRESMHFSRYALIHQLSSKYGSGFTNSQAVYGADHSR